MGNKIYELKPGDAIWVVSWHGRNQVIGVVKRVTQTQVIVACDYSFQGGANRSVEKYRRLNGKWGSGAGIAMNGVSTPNHLGDIPTEDEIKEFKSTCAEKHLTRMAFEASTRQKEALRKFLDKLLPEGCYVEIHDGCPNPSSTSIPRSFSVSVNGLESEAQVKALALLLRSNLKERAA